jgi:hypothetical protein
MRLSRRKYAEYRRERGLRGGSLEAVRKAIETGRIAIEPDGLIDADRADALWKINTAEASADPSPAHARGVKKATPKVTRMPAPESVLIRPLPREGNGAARSAVLDALRRITAPGCQFAFATVALRAGCTPVQAFTLALWYGTVPALALPELDDRDMEAAGFVNPTDREWMQFFGPGFDLEAAFELYDKATAVDLPPAA